MRYVIMGTKSGYLCLRKAFTTDNQSLFFRYYKQSLYLEVLQKGLRMKDSSSRKKQSSLWMLHVFENKEFVQIDPLEHKNNLIIEGVDSLDSLICKSGNPLDSFKTWNGSSLATKIVVNNQSLSQLINFPLVLFLSSSNLKESLATPLILVINILTLRKLRDDLSRIINSPGISLFTFRDLRQDLRRFLIPLKTSNLRNLENSKRKTSQLVQSLALILFPLLIYRFNNKFSIQNKISELIQIVNQESDYLSCLNGQKLRFLADSSSFLQTREVFDLLQKDHDFTVKFSELNSNLIKRTPSLKRDLSKQSSAKLSNLLSLDELAVNVVLALKESSQKKNTVFRKDRLNKRYYSDNARLLSLWKRSDVKRLTKYNQLIFQNKTKTSLPRQKNTYLTVKEEANNSKNKSSLHLKVKNIQLENIYNLIKRYSNLRFKIIESMGRFCLLVAKPSFINSLLSSSSSSKRRELKQEKILLWQDREESTFEQLKEDLFKISKTYDNRIELFLKELFLTTFNYLKNVKDWISEKRQYNNQIGSLTEKPKLFRNQIFFQDRVAIINCKTVKWRNEAKTWNYLTIGIGFKNSSSLNNEKNTRTSRNKGFYFNSTKSFLTRSSQILLNWFINDFARENERQEKIGLFDSKKDLLNIGKNYLDPNFEETTKNSLVYKTREEIEGLIQNNPLKVYLESNYSNSNDEAKIKDQSEKLFNKNIVYDPFFKIVNPLALFDVKNSFFTSNTIDFLDYINFYQSTNSTDPVYQKMNLQTDSQSFSSYNKLLAYSSIPSLENKRDENVYSNLKKDFSKDFAKKVNYLLFKNKSELQNSAITTENLTNKLWKDYIVKLKFEKLLCEKEGHNFQTKESFPILTAIKSKIWTYNKKISWESKDNISSHFEIKKELENGLNTILNLVKSQKKKTDILPYLFNNIEISNKQISSLDQIKSQDNSFQRTLSESIRDSKFTQPGNLTVLSQNTATNSLSNHNLIDLVSKDRKESLFSYVSNQKRILKRYIKWIFTPQWWIFFGKALTNIFPQIYQDVADCIKSTIPSIQNKRLNNISGELSINTLPDSLNIWQSSLLKENPLLWEEIKKGQDKIEPIWASLGLKNHLNSNNLAILSWLAIGYLIYNHYLSNLIGLGAIDLWQRSQRARHLKDPSFQERLDMLMHNSNDFPSQRFRWKAYMSNKWIVFGINISHKIREIIYYPLIGERFLKKSLTNSISLDLSRRQRELIVQSLITETHLVKYGLEYKETKILSQQEIGYRITEEQGLHFLQQLARTYHSYPNHTQRRNNILRERWIWSSFHNNTMTAQISWEMNDLKLKRKTLPICIQSGQSIPKGLLLIGPKETGKSYLIKGLAADSQIPLVFISVNKLIYNKPDFETKNWTEVLKESLKRLILILDLAKRLSPCIVWIPDIHELNVDRFTEEAESDPAFLLSALLKDLGNDSFRNKDKNILFVGSSHLPGKVEPALMSSNRLDRLVHVRMPALLQREKEISTFLRNKQFDLKNRYCLKELGYKTMGYNQRDLAGLANETLLIAITQGTKIVDTNTMRLALHRQTWGSSYVDEEVFDSANSQAIFYKVGRAIIQNTLLDTNPMLPLYARYDLWKTRFYYLSKAYIEPSFIQPVIKELSIIPHVLSCLAGSAARDVWLLLRKESKESVLSLDNSIENDFHLAASLFETLFVEFHVLNISHEKDKERNNDISCLFKTRNKFQMLDSNRITNKDLEEVSKNLNSQRIEHQVKPDISWSRRIWRLSLHRSSVFNWTRDSSQSISYKKKERSDLYSKNQRRELLPYERIFPKKQERKTRELESQLDEMLLKEETTLLGIQSASEAYPMGYESTENFVFFSGGRFIWNPMSLSLSHSHEVFSHRDILINQETLRKLYVTYGAKREREKSRPSRKMKQFFLRHGYGRQAISQLSTGSWDKTSSRVNQDFNAFKRMIQVGAQLRRPQLSMPVYMYENWLIENPKESFTRFGLLNNRNKALEFPNPFLTDSFIYGTLVESYNYLFEFFFSNKILLKRIVQTLLKERSLSQEQIEDLIYSYKWIYTKSSSKDLLSI